jgi:hypothetical protein
MRGVVATWLVVLGACAPPPSPDLPEGDVKLPDRNPALDNDAGAAKAAPATTSGPPPTSTLRVTLAGSGSGSISSTPAGLACVGTTCTATFPTGTTVTLAATAAPKSVFGGWTGQCNGTAACAPVMSGDVSITAAFESLDGTWSGVYTNTRNALGCTFNNQGTLSATLTSAAALSSTAKIDGLELRAVPGCNVVGASTGTARAGDITVANDTLTGTWTFNVDRASGTLAFPFTAKVTGKSMTGTWTCDTCTGSFTLTKQ